MLDQVFAVDLAEILAAIRKYDPKVKAERVRAAFEFGLSSHAEQKRFSGEPYFSHPIAVTKILLKLKPDEDTVITALLHDVVEDTPVELKVIEKNFGKQVAKMCQGLKKVGKVHLQGEERQIESLRKMFVAMAADLRVIFIKLADRLHNLQTLEYIRPDKQKRIARESLQIYAPIAARLGIYEFKAQIEDGAFRFLEPREFARLQQAIKGSAEVRKNLIRSAQQQLQNILSKQKFKVEISGRIKHFYSIWRKLLIKRCELNEIYDLFALRVLTQSIADCYAVLGVIHAVFKPLSNRFKDFIAMPKPNGYQSLHTTVIGLIPGQPVEVQIRTQEMHVAAEQGAAAHFQYAEKKRSVIPTSDKLKWVQNLLEMHEELRDNREFVESLTRDVFEDRIFVLTPRGDVFDLPTKATPVDFAYAVHTEVGHSCVGARVDGKIVALSSELQDGQVVEILTRKNAKPNRFWLGFVKTNAAMNKIKSFFASLDQSENLALGKALLNKKLVRLGAPPLNTNYSILKNYKNQRLTKAERDKLLEKVGRGSVRSSAVVRDLLELKELALPRPRSEVAAALGTSVKKEILVEGVAGIATKLAKCCVPVPGQPIVAILSRVGARIHRQDCRQIQRVAEDRKLKASFVGEEPPTRLVRVLIGGQNRVGLLRDIASIVAELAINIADLSLRRADKHTVLHELTLEISDLPKLDRLLGRLERIPGVTEVRTN